MEEKKSRFKLVSKQIPGTARFSLRILEIDEEGQIQKKKKSNKEKRRLRKIHREEKIAAEGATDRKRQPDEDSTVRPSQSHSVTHRSGSR